MLDYRLKELKVEVNRACPLLCLHCSSNSAPKALEKLSPKTVSELIKQFVYLGGERVCISGGEPLYYEELSSVINSCRLTNLDVSLYTTGIARDGGLLKPISEKTATLFADNNIKTIFSLHGASAYTHEKLTCVEGSFETTLQAIKRVKKAGALVELHVVPTTFNFHELADITELANSFNINKISWLRFVPQGRGWLNRKLLELSSEQIQSLTHIKLEIQGLCPSVTIRTGAPFNILCPQRPSSCEAGISELTIGPDGRVSPCDAFKRFVVPDDFGNILHNSLKEVWHKSYVLNSVRTLRRSESTSICASCSSYSRCSSGCLAQKVIAAGALTEGRDPGCLLGKSKLAKDELKAITVC